MGSSSACSPARACSGGSPRTSRRATWSRRKRLGRRGAVEHGRHDRVERRAQPFADVVVCEMAVVAELLARVADRELGLGDACAHRAEHLAELGRRPHPAERACARADHGDGLVAERVGRERPRRPVERVLERTRNGRVVLRRGEEDRIRLAHELTEGLDGLRARHDVVVLVVGRDHLQSLPEIDVDSLRRLLAQSAEEGRVVGVVAEGAADREDAHYASCATSVRSALRVTSFERAGSPFGSGMFHFMSNFVRSTVVESLKPTRVLPKWSTAGPVIVPVSVAGCVMPLIVISPSTVTLSPSRSMLLAEKPTTGCFSASKNSGESRCAWRFSSLTVMLSIFAAPDSVPSSRVASKSVTSPPKVATA